VLEQLDEFLGTRIERRTRISDHRMVDSVVRTVRCLTGRQLSLVLETLGVCTRFVTPL
jgi:hypothetical protein